VGGVHGPQLFRRGALEKRGGFRGEGKGSERRGFRATPSGSFTLGIILQFYRKREREERPCFHVLNFTEGICTPPLMLLPFPLHFTRFLARHKLSRHKLISRNYSPMLGTQFASTRLVDD